MDVPKYSWTPDTFCCFCPPLLYDGKETERARRGALLYRKWRRTEMRVTSVGNCAACDEISFEFCTFTNLDCSSSSSNLSFQIQKFIIFVGKLVFFPSPCCLHLHQLTKLKTKDKGRYQIQYSSYSTI